MRVDFNQIQERTMPCGQEGAGEMSARFYGDEGGKLISCRIHPGGSVGPHSHPASDELDFVLLGTGWRSATARRSFWSPGCATSAKRARSTASGTPVRATWCCSPWWRSAEKEGESDT